MKPWKALASKVLMALPRPESTQLITIPSRIIPLSRTYQHICQYTHILHKWKLLSSKKTNPSHQPHKTNHILSTLTKQKTEQRDNNRNHISLPAHVSTYLLPMHPNFHKLEIHPLTSENSVSLHHSYTSNKDTPTLFHSPHSLHTLLLLQSKKPHLSVAFHQTH
ncbi:hypothetical protein RND71_014846 [Anisodus tanguticus]|uniref:Uncharacterized protein n=1 Tax=Anisodus tanguticus TaxID=243964 RepID=A0AAE1SDJ2_9SOLA|nr:hypothetical protein RND71_014846 [Anisodus tanguticus]